MKKAWIDKYLLWSAIAVAMYPFYFWVKHPEFTEMQIFMKFYWLYLIAILLSLASFLIGNYKKHE